MVAGGWHVQYAVEEHTSDRETTAPVAREEQRSIVHCRPAHQRE